MQRKVSITLNSLDFIVEAMGRPRKIGNRKIFNKSTEAEHRMNWRDYQRSKTGGKKSRSILQ